MYNQFGQDRIEITQIANGWIVVLPPLPMPNKDLEMLRAGAKIMKSVIREDDVMNTIQEEVEREVKELTLSDLKTNNVHIFKTFKEVLAFLKYSMDEK